MTLGKYRPGSRVAQVYEYYREHGADAVFEFGKTLDLKDNTLRNWLRMWAKGEAPPPKKKPFGITADKSNRVWLTYDPDCCGTVVKKGDEQSEVKWDNGNVNIVPNDWIKHGERK